MILGDLIVIAILAAPIASLIALFRFDPMLLTARFMPPVH